LEVLEKIEKKIEGLTGYELETTLKNELKQLLLSSFTSKLNLLKKEILSGNYEKIHEKLIS